MDKRPKVQRKYMTLQSAHCQKLSCTPAELFWLHIQCSSDSTILTMGWFFKVGNFVNLSTTSWHKDHSQKLYSSLLLAGGNGTPDWGPAPRHPHVLGNLHQSFLNPPLDGLASSTILGSSGEPWSQPGTMHLWIQLGALLRSEKHAYGIILGPYRQALAPRGSPDEQITPTGQCGISLAESLEIRPLVWCWQIDLGWLKLIIQAGTLSPPIFLPRVLHILGIVL